MRKEEHNELLKRYLETANELPPVDQARVFVSGSPQDNLQLYEIIESCNATVIAEDHCWGSRYSDLLIDDSQDPLNAITDRYLFKPPCPRMFPMSRRIDYCLQKVEASHVHGVIFNVFEHDEAEAWEIPDKVTALKKIGKESLYLRNQPYLISEPSRVKMRIEEFLTTLKTTA